MSIRILDVVQGSGEWEDARRGMVTASVVGTLITPKTIKVADNIDSRALTMELVAERITGFTEPSYASFDMERGQYDEPTARNLYSEHIAPVTEAGFIVRDDWGFSLGYSPDGLVGEDGLLEVKSRAQKKHLATILSGEVPTENIPQLQCGLLVTDRAWVDYCSYCAGMPLYIIRVYPDPTWKEAIVQAGLALEKSARAMLSAYDAAVIGFPPTERPPEIPEMRF
jgi:hypothetical protein